MTNPFYDFDQFLAVVEDKPKTIRLLGKKWKLPPDAPAKNILKAKRIRADSYRMRERMPFYADNPDEDVTERDEQALRNIAAFDLEAELRKIVGDSTVDQWFDRGLGTDALGTVFWRIVGIYEGVIGPTDEGDGQGEAKAPKKGASRTTRSSRGGRSSGRTSRASTAKTS